LLHVANAIYDQTPLEDEIEVKLAHNLGKFIKEFMIPNLKLVTPYEPIYTVSAVTKSFLDSIRPKVYEMCYFKSRKSPLSIKDSPEDRTITVRDMILTMNKYQLIDKKPFKGLLVKDVINTFLEIVPPIKIDENYNLQYELLPEEVLEGLVVCSLFRLSKGGPKNTNPALALAYDATLESIKKLNLGGGTKSAVDIPPAVEITVTAPVATPAPAPTPTPAPVATPAPAAAAAATPAKKDAQKKGGKNEPAAKANSKKPEEKVKVIRFGYLERKH
jgi:hypothetical protein